MVGAALNQSSLLLPAMGNSALRTARHSEPGNRNLVQGTPRRVLRFQPGGKYSDISTEKKNRKNETNQNREKTQEHLENAEIFQEYPQLTSETVSKITPYSKHRKGLFRYNRLPNGRALLLSGLPADKRSKIICRVKKCL